MTVAALVLGAGRGERFGAGVSKAFVPLAGRPLLAHALEALAASPRIDLVMPVVARDDLPRVEALTAGLDVGDKLAPAVAGGALRQDSVRAGLAALGSEVDWVAVHDAARPCLRSEDVTRVVEAAFEHGAAILAVPVRDTIKRVRGGVVAETPLRGECYAAQTPQVMRRDWLEKALEAAMREGVVVTDDAEGIERLGWRVHVVEGDPANQKITVAADLVAAEAWWKARSAAPGERGQ